MKETHEQAKKDVGIERESWGRSERKDASTVKEGVISTLHGPPRLRCNFPE
jgi:hypothetical protein